MTIDAEATAVSSGAPATSTELVVFDFDETIVDCNSDTYINALAPGGTVPAELWATFQNDNDWTAYMQQVFKYLGAAGVTEADYRRCLATMPFVEGMKALLGRLAAGLKQQQVAFEVIVISDANSFFINYTLQYHQLDAGVKKVFTNPAAFDPATGVLQMERYHEQNWCPLSARNLCPSLKLAAKDRVFPRAGYPLHKLTLAKAASKELQAAVYPFTSGEDIWKVIVAGVGQ